MNLCMVWILSCCLATGSASASELPMPPLPDFSNHVNYVDYLVPAGQECRVQIVSNHQAKAVSCPRPSEQVKAFIEGVLESPQAWMPAEHKDVAKWVDDVQANSSRYLDDLPWMVFDPKSAMFSEGEKPESTVDLVYPNLGDLRYVVYADLMAALRDGQEDPMPFLDHALACMKDCSECRDFVNFSIYSRLYHKLVLVSGWLAQNRDIPLDSLSSYVDRLAEIQGDDLRQRFDAAMHVECASMLSLIQWLGMVGSDGEVRYDAAKVKTCSDLMMTEASAWAMLNQKDADPQRDAKQCLAYFEDVCEAIGKTVKRPKTGAFGRIDEEYAKNQYFALCFPTQWAGTWIQKMLEFERKRRLDMLTLKLVIYKKEHGEWPKNLRPVTGEDKALGIDPLTGRRFKYYVKKGEARLDNASLVVGASG